MERKEYILTLAILASYGFFKELRPSEPYLTEYLIDDKYEIGLAKEDVYTKVKLGCVSACDFGSVFVKNGPSSAYFFVYFCFFKHTLHFFNKYMWKNVHPVYGAGIRTHDLRNMSLLP